MSDRPELGTPVSPSGEEDISYRVSQFVGSEQLNELLTASWDGYVERDFGRILRRSLLYVCAYRAERLVGFVNVAWDGGVHAFILDTTVHPDFRHRGIGRHLVVRASEEARGRGAEWLHVDFEPNLEKFYRGCGFRPTQAGLLNLTRSKP